MKKQLLPIITLMAALVVTGCNQKKGSSSPVSSSGSQTSTSSAGKSSSSAGSSRSSSAASSSSSKASSSSSSVTPVHVHNWKAGTKDGVVTPETCECGMKAYRLDVNDADPSGWHDGGTKFNKKTADAPNNVAFWNIAGKIPAGSYDIALSAKMSYSTHSNRYWFNHALNNKDDDGNPPDSTSESPFRYFFKIDDGADLNPELTDTWGEEGLTADSFNFVTIVTDAQISATTAKFSLCHGDIGYSLIIESIRLIAKPTELKAPVEFKTADATASDPKYNSNSEKMKGTLAWDVTNAVLPAGAKVDLKIRAKITTNSDDHTGATLFESAGVPYYTIKVNGNAVMPTDTTSTRTDLGWNTSDFADGLYLANYEIPANLAKIELVFTASGYSLYIDGLTVAPAAK